MSYWVLNEKWIIVKNKEKKRKDNVAQQRVYLTKREVIQSDTFTVFNFTTF